MGTRLAVEAWINHRVSGTAVYNHDVIFEYVAC